MVLPAGRQALLPLLEEQLLSGWPMLQGALAILLGLGAARLALWATRFVWVYFARPARDPCQWGPWAVVTGATDGIGRAYSHLLAARGLNILLVSRPESPLAACAADLEARYGVATRTCAVDLCVMGPQERRALEAALEGLEVGMLLNNAGQYMDYPQPLEDFSHAFLAGHLTINALAPTLASGLCKLVLPGMKARRRGLIVNVGSGVACAMLEAPYLAAYGASKAYLDSLTRALDAECAPHGVRVQNLWPMWVATKMAKISEPSMLKPSPATWAAAALRQMGRETSITPYWFHALLAAALQLAPETGRRNNLAITLAWREQELAALAGAGKAQEGGMAAISAHAGPAANLRRRK